MKASKRKSGSESTQKSKSQRALVDGSVSESTVDDSGPVKLFTSWLSNHLETHQSIDRYLARTLNTEDKMLSFLQFVEQHFPPETGVSYCKAGDMEKNCSVLLRPWHLVHLPQCGLKGLVEPDSHLMLCQLMVGRGLKTDPSMPGVERLSISSMRPDAGCKPSYNIPPSKLGGECSDDMLWPQHAFMVKGWSRSVSALTVLLACWEDSEFFEAWPESLRRTFCTIHANVCVVAGLTDPGQLVTQNRSITMESTAVRRRPNCFNLVFQMRLMSKFGKDGAQELKVWNSAAELIQAYSIGRSEANAALNLLNHIPAGVGDRLAQLVKQYSMQKFVTHEALASGMFNEGECLATGSQTSWAEALTLNPKNLGRFVERMACDYANMGPKMRKAWNSKDLDPLLRSCCLYTFCEHAFVSKFPNDFCTSQIGAIEKGFMLKHGDNDLLKLMDESVPPVDLSRVGLFRVAVSKYQKQVDDEKNNAAEELAQRLQAASSEQTASHLSADIVALLDHCEKIKLHSEQQGSLDIKYLATRFEKGQQAVKELMEKKHRYVQLEQSLLESQADFLQWQGETSHSAVSSLPTIMILDASLWPSRHLALDEAAEVAKSICHGNCNAVLLVLLPVVHAGISHVTIVKYRRALEDRFVGAMEVTDVSLQFTDSLHAADKRKRTQQCLLIASSIHKSHGMQKSKAWLGVLTGLQRARVSELVSDDYERPANPPQRAAQRGVACTRQIIAGIIEGAEYAEGIPVYVVDLIHSRFNEWGRATWLLQHDFIKSNRGFDWRFVAYMTEDDAVASDSSSYMATAIQSDWWDGSDEAGPANRPQAPLQDPVPTMKVLTISGTKVALPQTILDSLGDHAGKLQEKVDSLNQNPTLRYLQPPAAGSQVQTPGATAAQQQSPIRSSAAPRTLCYPSFTPPDAPISITRVATPLAKLTVGSSKCDKELFVSCKLTANDSVTVALTGEYECWLLNDADESVQLAACELFGFGLGSFNEIGASLVRTAGDRMLPWLLQADTELMVLVNVDSGTKKLTCLAEIACQTCQTSGITDLSMIDHDISAKLEDSGNPVAFRYCVTPKHRINTFEPKPTPPDANRTDMRATMLGNTMAGNLLHLTGWDFIRQVWEVKVNPTPAVVTPLKPKMWLCCAVEIPAKTAVRLG